MKISMGWLNQYIDIVDFFAQPEKLVERLNSVGIEVESFEDLGKKYQNVVVGHIEEKSSHPHADRLTLCRVNVGEGHLRQIVCGATNHMPGDRVVVALPGAFLPGGLEIKRSKIRQIESEGMLCSEAELGLTQEGSKGIMILPPSAPVGQPFSELMGSNDIVLEVNVTPNRADCLSHLGLAREIKALLNRPIHVPLLDIQASSDISAKKRMRVEVKNHSLCPRYAGRVIAGVKIAPSPNWLKRRLENVGIKSINNVVDVTNYVMFECGQPLHAFDLDQINDGKIVIDKSQEGEKFVTLDGTELELTGDELMIRDNHRSLALAGVVGGLHSGVTSSTTQVFIEGAQFAREMVRKTSRHWGIHTESSYRFSRGIDPENVLRAVDRACQLIQQLAGGKITEDFFDVYPSPLPEKKILIRLNYLQDRLGYNISPIHFEEWMIRIGCALKKVKTRSEIESDSWEVIPPSFRWDLEMEVDLVEEFARLYGYNHIPETFPLLSTTPSSHDSSFINENRVSDILVGEGFLEAVNFSFIGQQFRKEWMGKTKGGDFSNLFPSLEGIKIQNPLNEETNEMRVSLLPGLFANMLHNARQGLHMGRLFEVGPVYYQLDETSKVLEKQYQEKRRIGLISWGQSMDLWNKKVEHCPIIYSLKSNIENMLSHLLLNSFQWKKISEEDCPDFIHPAQAVSLFVEGKVVGLLGTLHPSLLQKNKIRLLVAVAEINFDGLMRNQPRLAKVKNFSRFPQVERDLALLVPAQVGAGDLLQEMKKLGGETLESVVVFDVYQDEKLKDRRSVGYRLVFRDRHNTLSEPQVSDLQNHLVNGLKKRFPVEIRE